MLKINIFIHKINVSTYSCENAASFTANLILSQSIISSSVPNEYTPVPYSLALSVCLSVRILLLLSLRNFYLENIKTTVLRYSDTTTLYII